MSREYLEAQQLHPFATTKDNGVGIGLYQCKTVIEKNGRQDSVPFCAG
jgi:phosphoglycerate-specific signal transduction histidine kinase